MGPNGNVNSRRPPFRNLRNKNPSGHHDGPSQRFNTPHSLHSPLQLPHATFEPRGRGFDDGRRQHVHSSNGDPMGCPYTHVEILVAHQSDSSGWGFNPPDLWLRDRQLGLETSFFSNWRVVSGVDHLLVWSRVRFAV